MIQGHEIHNVEAEESILGGILLDPCAMGRIADILNHEDFYLTDHQKIYRAALALYKEKKPTDLMLVTDYLQERSELDSIGGTCKLAQLINRTVTAVNIDRYAKLVKEKAILRAIVRSAYDIIERAVESGTTLDEKIAFIRQVADNIENSITFQSAVLNLFEIYERNSEKLQKLVEGSALSYPGTGFSQLDRLLGGLKPGMLVLGARPSVGKTALAIAIAINVAAKKHPVLYFSMEQSAEQIWSRIVARFSNIPYSRLDNGHILNVEEPAFWEGIVEATELPIFIDDRAELTLGKIRQSILEIIKKTGVCPPLIVIDYLQLMSVEGEKNRNLQLGKISRDLKILSRDFNTHVLLLSQLSREVEKRNDKRPVMSDVRDSGEIEQNTDAMLLLYREDYYKEENPQGQNRNIVEGNMVKNRLGGKTGNFKLFAELGYTKFLDLKY